MTRILQRRLIAGRWLAALLPLILLVAAGRAGADDQLGPYQTVEQGTSQVLSIAKEAKGYYDQDPERYYKQIGAVLDKFVDFKYFARAVMGKYASVRRYRALDSEQEKQAFRDRIDRFAKEIKRVLIVTYAKGLLTFNSKRIETEKPNMSPDDRYVDVTQQVYGDQSQPYILDYLVARNRDGEWKVRNMTVDGVNLGEVYRNQFASAVEKHQGDLDAVVNNWGSESAPVKVGKDKEKADAEKADNGSGQ